MLMSEMPMVGKILLVEDDPTCLRNIAEFLREEGYEVVEARDGAEAFEQLLTTAFDLIVTDIRMPRTDGIRLLQLARILSPNIPVILMTSFVASDAREDVISPDADDFISKPFALDRLLQKIHRTFESRAAT